MLLVHGLAADPERRRDLRPRPPLAHGALDLAGFEAVGERAQRDDGGEPLRRIARDRLLLGGNECHASTVVDNFLLVNFGCYKRISHLSDPREYARGELMKRVVAIALLLFCWVFPASALADDERIVIVGDVLVDRDETTGDILVADGDVTVRGTVDGDIFVADGDVTIRGEVKGDVVTFAGTAILGRRAHVEGDLAYGDKKPQVASGAQVDGDIEKFKAEDFSGGALALQIGIWIAATVSLFVLGLILLLLFPKAADAVGRSGKGMSLLVGLVAIILIPLIAILSLVTLVGIPLGVILLLLIVPLCAIGYVAGAFMVGRLVSKKGKRILTFVIGLLILRVLALIPFLGGLVSFLALLMGLGALLHRRAARPQVADLQNSLQEQGVSAIQRGRW